MPKELNLYSKYKYIWEQLDNTMDSLFSYIQSYPLIAMDSYGNITVSNTKENADKVPVFCCHLDTVHSEEPQLELIHNDILMTMGGGGVGGDDKCGIVACLELLQRVPCKCLFFRDEESGCKGSRQFNAKSLKNNLFCIEIDRRGSSDLIFSASGGQMCSEEFQERAKKAFPHGTPAQGSLTDVCVLRDAEINMMYVSGGYYRPHSDKEYVVLSELQRNIDCLVVLANDIMNNPLKDKTYKRSVISYATKGYTPRTWGSYQTGVTTSDGGAEESGEDLFGRTSSDYDNPGEDAYQAMQYGRYKKSYK